VFLCTACKRLHGRGVYRDPSKVSTHHVGPDASDISPTQRISCCKLIDRLLAWTARLGWLQEISAEPEIRRRQNLRLHPTIAAGALFAGSASSC
jgi:hypothetical protein